ncbi:MAG: ATP synthase F1 subunit epsilon [Actinomycetota bacterium]|nr:ATP synthase F1 subunit epsilon [Rubrobacter sp.]MDQ3507448.1 ATP synthase F1 subunit epsilon [Actinomycetota bacterium]
MASGRQLFCRIITPERMVYDGEAEMVKVRIADGDIGVMADHQPIVSTVGIRDVQVVKEGDEREVFAVSDGFFKVSENLVQILVEEATSANDIDADAAENDVEEADRELSELSGGDDEEEAGRRREELQRRRSIGENMARVARRYGE